MTEKALYSVAMNLSSKVGSNYRQQQKMAVLHTSIKDNIKLVQIFMVPGGLDAQNSHAHEGEKVVRPAHRPHLPRRKYSWYSFLLEVKSTPGT
jgi:hypothetical protein